MKKLILSLLIATSCLLLSTCAHSGYRPQGAEISANQYLQMAEMSTGQERQQHLLDAANRLLQDQQIKAANDILTSINTTELSSTQQTQLTLLRAEYRLKTHQSQEALKLLSPIGDTTALPADQKIKFYELQAQAFLQQNQVLSSIIFRTRLMPYLNDEQRKTNTLAIWHSLQNQSNAQLQEMLRVTNVVDYEGWIRFAMIANNPQTNASALIQSLKQWQQQYPNHPANLLIGNMDTSVDLKPAKHIALLLPLTGPLSDQGAAVRNGFFAAYYDAKKQNPNAPTIMVYDTQGQEIPALYEQAVKEGADFIVGPLSKSEVSALAEHTSLTVPTLALNNLHDNNDEHYNNLYQFSLSPTQEARQAAEHAWYQNLNRAIIIAPLGPWGDQIAGAFKDRWTALGGTVINTLMFQNPRLFAEQLAQTLNVDQSQQRATQLKNILHSKIRTIARRREDFDVVFLAALPVEARQLRPLLRFYFAGNIPVYAPSFIYTGRPNEHLDHDLNGIIFEDMPWVIDPEQDLTPTLMTIQRNVQTLWPASYQSQPKLYAFGVDAYTLAATINKLIILPDVGQLGATGRLYLEDNGHVRRELIWAQMVDGKPNKL